MTRMRQAAPGLTLVEFLFATSVTAFVMLGVAGMFPSALRNVVVGGQTTKAAALATEMVEAIKNDNFGLLIARYNNFNTKDTQIPEIRDVNCLTLLPPQGFDSFYTRKKWKCDLLAGSSQALGQGLPNGYGTVSVTCRNTNGTVNTTTPCPTRLLRVVVTVFWGRSSERSVSYATYVAQAE